MEMEAVKPPSARFAKIPNTRREQAHVMMHAVDQGLVNHGSTKNPARESYVCGVKESSTIADLEVLDIAVRTKRTYVLDSAFLFQRHYGANSCAKSPQVFNLWPSAFVR